MKEVVVKYSQNVRSASCKVAGHFLVKYSTEFRDLALIVETFISLLPVISLLCSIIMHPALIVETGCNVPSNEVR